MPVYQLLGGKTRDKARVYYHVFGQTREELVQGCIDAKAQGFTAVGHLTPFTDEPRDEPYFKTHAAKMGDAIETVRQYREAVGDEVDLCIEIHRRLTPGRGDRAGARHRAVPPATSTKTRCCPTTSTRWRWSPQHIDIPIATGERLHTIYEFEMLLARGAVQYVRPDVCMCGGITGAKKIAALAEARHVGVVPHNPLGPVSTAACLQLAACIPNFALQEYPLGEDRAAEERDREDDGAARGRLPDHPRRAGHRHRAGGGRGGAPPLQAARRPSPACTRTAR